MDVAAPDGNRYYGVLPPSLHLLSGYQKLLEAEAVARTIPGPEGRSRALAIDVLLTQVQTEVTAAAEATAVQADSIIRTLIDKTRKRPPGSSRLEDAVESRAILTQPAGGAVGIGDMTRLDQLDYWKAQEFGSAHLVGKRIRGLFMPGGAAPDPSQFRVHPIFEVGGGSSMLVTRPIEARHFMRDGLAEAANFRSAQFRRINTSAVAEMQAILRGSHPLVTRTRRVVRGRGRP